MREETKSGQNTQGPVSVYLPRHGVKVPLLGSRGYANQIRN